MTRDSVSRLRFAHYLFHQLPDVLHVQAGSVESAIGSHRSQDLADGTKSTVAGSVAAFNNKSCSAHTNDEPRTAAIKGDGGLFSAFVGSSRSTGEEPGA